MQISAIVRVCVRVHALHCRVFMIAVYLGNNVILYQLSQLTLQVTVNSCNATPTRHSGPTGFRVSACCCCCPLRATHLSGC